METIAIRFVEPSNHIFLEMARERGQRRVSRGAQIMESCQLGVEGILGRVCCATGRGQGSERETCDSDSISLSAIKGYLYI